MVFVACGLNHKTAPISVREKVAFTPATHVLLLNDLITQSTINEAAVLSTCNRMEIYCDTTDPAGLIPWLADRQQLPTEDLSPFIYMHHGQEGIRHTLRVASGLDSMMLGEPQILGQMKQAYSQACLAGTVKSNLRSVFEYIFQASKRVRSLSGIGTNPVSVAYAAVQLVNRFFQELTGLRVLLIGSGETATLVSKYLHKAGVREFMIASRTRENAALLAESFQGKPLSISDIADYLPKADVVISATACPLPFINKNMVQHALSNRAQAPMFFLDLAVPRDIEPEVAELGNVALYNIDSLQTMITQGMDERRTAALQAEQLIESELDQFIRLHRTQQAKHLICNYRDHMQTLAEQELKRSLSKLSAGTDQETVLQELCNRLVNKLTHYPVTGLRQTAWDGRVDLLELAGYLFNINRTQADHEEIT